MEINGSVSTIDMPRWVVAGPLAVSADGAEARFHDRKLHLTRAQRLILLALVARGGRIARRSEIYDQAFGRPLSDGSRAVDTHVARIRRALGESGTCIVTVGRVGYRLDLETLENGSPSET
jgi:two-component system OmpR family response regulator